MRIPFVFLVSIFFSIWCRAMNDEELLLASASDGEELEDKVSTSITSDKLLSPHKEHSDDCRSKDTFTYSGIEYRIPSNL